MAKFEADTAVVLQEQAFLETYFHCLSKFAHDKAKEIIEKEKSRGGSLLWSSMLHLINTLAVSEKEYFSLVFLSPNLGSRLLGRKDALRTTYSCLLTELQKIENAHKTMVAVKAGKQQNLEQFLSAISGQLQHYISSRIKMIAFCEQLLSAGHNNNNIMIKDLLNTITIISQPCQTLLQHPILSSLKFSFHLECSIISQLLSAQLCIQKCRFLPALRNLYQAHMSLNSWATLIGLKETKKLGFVSGSSKAISPIELFEWLLKYKGILISKFGLYFCDILSRQGPSQDYKGVMSKTSVDFYGRLVSFQKKTDAACICIVLNTTELEEPYLGFGYHRPQRATPIQETDVKEKKIAGFEDYPTIFSHPAERPEKHWPTVIVTLTRKSLELNKDQIVYVHDEKYQSSFFLIRIDPCITLVLIYEMKRQERDGYVTNFLQTITSEMRCTKIFAALKPGSK